MFTVMPLYSEKSRLSRYFPSFDFDIVFSWSVMNVSALDKIRHRQEEYGGYSV